MLPTASQPRFTSAAERPPARSLAAGLAATALVAWLTAPTGAPAQLASTHVVVLDQDAHDVSLSSAGAVFSVDLGAGTSAAPQLEAAADGGAPFEFLSGMELSPFDGQVYVSDFGAGAGDGSVYAVNGTSGAIRTVVTGHLLLPDPFDLAFVTNGPAGRRLVVVDWDSDPSGLGPDSVGGTGHGALFWVDEATGAVTLLSDGTDFPPTLPGVVDSAFEDPVAVAYDPVRDTLYVADRSADPLGVANAGAVYAVDPATGAVTLVSSTFNFASLTAIAVRPDGTPLVVDPVQDDSVVWTIDLSNADPETNAAFFTAGIQYVLVEDIAVDAASRVFVIDSGEYDPGPPPMFLIPPGVYFVDESVADPELNAVLLNASDELVSPVAIEAVPAFRTDSLSPSRLPSCVVSGMPAALQGAALAPWLELDFGPRVTIDSQTWGDAAMSGDSLALTLSVPAGLAGAVNLGVTHPFGGGTILGGALADGGAPPCSTRGDASCDGIVDGIDLAILGQHFAERNCVDPGFVNDADFNDDDAIDGMDLTVLATFFGTRP